MSKRTPSGGAEQPRGRPRPGAHQAAGKTKPAGTRRTGKETGESKARRGSKPLRTEGPSIGSPPAPAKTGTWLAEGTPVMQAWQVARKHLPGSLPDLTIKLALRSVIDRNPGLDETVWIGAVAGAIEAESLSINKGGWINEAAWVAAAKALAPGSVPRPGGTASEPAKTKTVTGAVGKDMPMAKKARQEATALKKAKTEAVKSEVDPVVAGALKSEVGLALSPQKLAAPKQAKSVHQSQPDLPPASGPEVASTPAPKPMKLKPGVKLFTNDPGVPLAAAASSDPEIDFGGFAPPDGIRGGHNDVVVSQRPETPPPSPPPSALFTGLDGQAIGELAPNPRETDLKPEVIALNNTSENNRVATHLGAQPPPPDSKTHRVAIGGAGSVAPTIERVPHEEPIRVGAGGTLVVPREDIGAEIDEGSELDLAAMIAKKHRKPGRREWIALNPASELPTRMLLHKPKADGMDVDYYYVDPALRGPIRDELKDVRVFVYYSFTTRAHALWIVNVTLENTWYESVAAFLQKPADFFAKNAIKVMSDKDNSRYRVRFKPLPAHVAWPAMSTSQLLGEAIGPSRFITTPDHPLYLDLTEGTELD